MEGGLKAFNSLKIDSMKNNKILIKKIYLQDERFRISYFFDNKKLERSIAESGVHNRIWLVKREGKLIVASGWRRIQACRELKIEEVPYRILYNLNDLLVFRAVLLENLSIREFDVLEKAWTLRNILKFGLQVQEILKDYCLLINVPRSHKYVHDFVNITDLNHNIKQLIYKKRIPFQIARLFLDYSEEEQELLGPILGSFGINKIKEVLELVAGISKRENKNPLVILKAKELESLWLERKLNSVQKADKFLDFLRRKYYSNFYRTTKKIEKILTELNWPKDVILKPYHFFEKDEYSLEFSFSSQKEFKEKINKLMNAAESQLVKKLFSIFTDE